MPTCISYTWAHICNARGYLVTQAHTCTHVCTCRHTGTHTWAHTRAFVMDLLTSAYTYTNAQAQIHLHAYKHMCVHAHMCVHTSRSICTQRHAPCRPLGWHRGLAPHPECRPARVQPAQPRESVSADALTLVLSFLWLPQQSMYLGHHGSQPRVCPLLEVQPQAGGTLLPGMPDLRDRGVG